MKIVSGGQTGVDRAALDFALKNNFECGGFCPSGRIAEDGVIDMKYLLTETESEKYEPRTEMNVLHSDGTLILNRGTSLSGGTEYTYEITEKHQKPCLIIDLTADEKKIKKKFSKWRKKNDIKTLNIAGPRESKEKGIYRQVLLVLGFLFER